jgi:hypothetical protein
MDGKREAAGGVATVLMLLCAQLCICRAFCKQSSLPAFVVCDVCGTTQILVGSTTVGSSEQRLSRTVRDGVGDLRFGAPTLSPRRTPVLPLLVFEEWHAILTLPNENQWYPNSVQCLRIGICGTEEGRPHTAASSDAQATVKPSPGHAPSHIKRLPPPG